MQIPKTHKVLLGVGVAVMIMAACRKETHGGNFLLADADEAFSGGLQGTVFDQTTMAFGIKVTGLSTAQQNSFFVGNSFFQHNWVTAPSTTTARDGLGPLFNSRSCGGCHFKDGRGRPFDYNGETGTGFLIRLSIPGTGSHGEPLPDPLYGGQIQDQGIIGVSPEATVYISWVEIPGTYPDGTPYSLRKPVYTFQNLAYGALSAGYMISPRVAPQICGLGLLENIPEQDILALADEWDADGDGISGRANYVYDFSSGNTVLGRFGWKANQPDLYQQTAGAFLGDMGITSSLFPNENCTSAETDCQNAPSGGAPEIADSDLDDVVLYERTLAVPARRDWKAYNVLEGKKHFIESGCAKCHVTQFTTAANASVPSLGGQVIRPYTDLLLHDMGNDLADGRPDFLASGNEWRTPPLWGLGLIQTVNGHTYLLHDGRARNMEEAILWHGGEGENAKNRFKQLTAAQRNQVITFLRSL